MCPSYQVTQEEEHSTRGRARLLFEMLDGHGDSPITDGWRVDAVADALDLCLACKGCKTDCPANVDMATYKAEFLAHHYAGPPWRRPRSDLALGWLPVAARAVARLRLARVVNALTPRARCCTGWRPRSAAWRRAARCRCSPARRLQQWYAPRGGPRGDGPRAGTVLLWPDTFTNHFHPHVGQAAVEVLEDAGWRVELPDRAAVLRPDLDLHRPAGHRQAGAAAHRRRPRRARPRRRLRGRPRAELHRGVPLRRARAVPRRPGRRCGCATTRVTLAELLHRAHPRLAAAARCDRAGARPGALPPARRARAGTPTRELLEARGRRRRAPGVRLLRPGRQLRLRAAATSRSAEACAERVLLPALRDGRPGDRGPRRRLQLPHPDPRARQRRPGGHAPGRAARRRGQPRLRTARGNAAPRPAPPGAAARAVALAPVAAAAAVTGAAAVSCCAPGSPATAGLSRRGSAAGRRRRPA